MSNPEFVYSLDGEWFDEYDNILDELYENCEPGEKVSLYKGRPEEITHRDIVESAFARRSFIELLQETAYDEDGEAAEDYLSDLNNSDELEEMIVNFLNENAKKPGYSRIYDITEEIVTVEGYDE